MITSSFQETYQLETNVTEPCLDPNNVQVGTFEGERDMRFSQPSFYLEQTTPIEQPLMLFLAGSLPKS